MLKLFKYEMIQSWRNYMFVFFGYLLLCLVIPISDKIDLNENFQAILIFLLTFMIMGILIGLFITIARNYKNSMFGRSGYLTLTLPVNTHELLAAKLLASLVWVILSGIVLLLGFFLMMISIAGFATFIQGLPDIFKAWCSFLQEAGWEIFQVCLSLAVSILTFIMLIYFALTTSHTCYIRNHRTFWAIVIMVLYNSVLSAFSNSLSLGMLGIFSAPASAFIYGLDYFQSLWINMGWNLIQSIALYLGTWFFLEKKLEVQ